MTGKIYISKENPHGVLRNAIAERKERFDRSSKRFLSCVKVAENVLQLGGRFNAANVLLYVRFVCGGFNLIN